VLAEYARRERAEIDVKSFPPRLALGLHSRAMFIEKVFWRCLQAGGMIVGLNLPFDLSRLAVEWGPSRNRGWSLVLSLRRSCDTGQLEPNPHRPRVRVAAKDSRSAFISLTRPRNPEEWPAEGRFLDLHSFASALFDKSYSLDDLCKALKVRGKEAYEPTGRISDAEIAYCRSDVRATGAALNGLKQEFDRHPFSYGPIARTRPPRWRRPTSMQ
jgi:hypothetical protein